MANVANTYLSDKDIRMLKAQDKRYFKVVGNPKELCIFINPKRTKKFSLRLKQKGVTNPNPIIKFFNKNADLHKKV